MGFGAHDVDWESLGQWLVSNIELLIGEKNMFEKIWVEHRLN